MVRLEMKNYSIYHINREDAKISVLSSGKIDKYECLTQGIKFCVNNRLICTSFGQCLLCKNNYSFP